MPVKANESELTAMDLAVIHAWLGNTEQCVKYLTIAFEAAEQTSQQGNVL